MSDKTESIEVECTLCHKIFLRTLHRHKEAIKMGYHPFCSKECRDEYKITSPKEKCYNCGKGIIVSKGQFNKSISKRFYCNKSCAAISNNKIKGPKSLETKNNIRNGIVKYYDGKGRKPKPIDFNKKTRKLKNCIICGNNFKPHRKIQVCCNKKCGQLYQFGILPYTKDDLINKILEISKETGRTPQKRDCDRRLEGAAIKFFGAWNKAMVACNLKPNSSKYQKIRLKCLDGHISDSISEKIIDDWFYKNNIKHEKNKKYPNSNFNCDFYFTDYDLWVEYFGLFGGRLEEYDKTIIEKEKIAVDNGLRLVKIFPDDLYKDTNMSYAEKLMKIFEKYV